MGLSTALQGSMLPQTLSMLQGFIKEEAERQRQEEKRRRVEQTAGEITKMFSSLPDNPTLEQLNNVSKQAMMLAYKQDSEEALKVVDPLRGMAVAEMQQKKEMKTSDALSHYFGITDKDIASMPPALMMDAVKMAESMKRQVNVKDAEGRSYVKVFDHNGNEIQKQSIMIDPSTNADRFQMFKREQDVLKKNRMAEIKYTHGLSEGKPYQYIGTSGGYGLTLNQKTGQIEQSEIKVDSKNQAKIKFGEYNQLAKSKAQEILNEMSGAAEIRNFWGNPFSADDKDYDPTEKMKDPKFDPETELARIISGGFVSQAIKDRGNEGSKNLRFLLSEYDAIKNARGEKEKELINAEGIKRKSIKGGF